MSRYRFDVATAADDDGLRAFLADQVMPGTIQLRFRREPDYFAPGGTFGPFHQTIVCRDTETTQIVGTGCRSVGTVHVDGRPESVGYLSMLRSIERVRSGLLLARGYRHLRALHDDDRAPYYLTTIAEGNDVALSVLTSGRAGLPTYRPAGRYTTFAVPTRIGRRAGPDDQPVELDEVIAFLASHGKTRQFFPAYETVDFAGPLTGLTADDLVVARHRSGRIRGVMGLWDQRPFRQTEVAGYQGLPAAARHVYNLASSARRRPTLPQPGGQLQYGYVALPAVEDDDPATVDRLLRSVAARASSRGLQYVLFGCHRDDPLWPLIRPHSFLTYETHVYLVHWGPDDVLPDVDAAPIHLELGCL